MLRITSNPNSAVIAIVARSEITADHFRECPFRDMDSLYDHG